MTIESSLLHCHDFMVIIDTNMFFVANKDVSYSPFLPIRDCENFFNKKRRRPFLSFGKYMLPQIVFYEIAKQKEKYFQQISQETSQYWHLNIQPPNFQQDLTNYLVANNISILGYPQPIKLHSIIQRALDKRPPFEGKAKQSDKGFKDVVLWESLLEYPYENQRIGKVFLITNDSIFQAEGIQKEFKEIHPDIDFMICKTWQEFENEESLFSSELIARSSINQEYLLEILRDNDPTILRIINPAKKVQGKFNSPIVILVAEIEKQDGTICSIEYFYDINVNDMTLSNPDEEQ